MILHVGVGSSGHIDCAELIFDLVGVYGLAELVLTLICILSNFDDPSSSFLEFCSET